MFIDNYIPTAGHSYAGGICNHFTGRHFDPGLRRPYLDKYDRPCVTVNTGRWTVEKGERVPLRERRFLRDLILNGTVPPVFNATALRKEEWIQLDTVVLRSARYRLRAWADLAAANSFGGFNGMSKLILEHEVMSDPGEAIVDMDGLTEGRTDAPKFQLRGLPLPITHSDFFFDARRLAISRNSGTPLDTTMGESAGRRIAESVEKTTIGNQTGMAFGGLGALSGGGQYDATSQVYGYTNFPARLTKTNMTAPSAGGWNPETTQKEVNTCLNTLRLNKFYGPFVIYTSTDWDPYLDGDYYALATSGMAAPSQTLRNRLKQIDGVQDVRRLDFLFASAPSASIGPGGENLVSGGGGSGGSNPFTMVFVQMTPDVARAVVGMDITTVQWEAIGGMRINFKVMCIMVPQIRADFYNNCGILHATTA